MMLVRTYLANSAIEGVGIFATEPIKAGEVIWKLEPKFDLLLTAEQIESWPPHMQDFIERYCYSHMYQSGIWILETDNGRFMNHSCSPNSDFSSFYEGIALRSIEAGEELTCNYYDFDVNFKGQFHSSNQIVENQVLQSFRK